MRTRSWKTTSAAALLSCVLLLSAPITAAGAAPVQDPTVAPVPTVSGDGLTVTAGGKSLSASQTAGLAAAGQSVTVSGRGYDPGKGVYVGLCVVPPTNHPPSPCGGGQDRSGAGGASAWVSSNPPSYAAGLTTPYGPGGTFTITVRVSPEIGDGLDCWSVRCAVVTRNDHTRGSDRSHDLFLPVTFAQPAPPPTVLPATGAPPETTATTVPTTIAPTTTTTTAPTTTVVDRDDDRDEDTAEATELAAATRDDGGGGGGSATLPLLAAGAVAVLSAAGTFIARARRRPVPAPDTP